MLGTDEDGDPSCLQCGHVVAPPVDMAEVAAYLRARPRGGVPPRYFICFDHGFASQKRAEYDVHARTHGEEPTDG